MTTRRSTAVKHPAPRTMEQLQGACDRPKEALRGDEAGAGRGVLRAHSVPGKSREGKVQGKLRHISQSNSSKACDVIYVSLPNPNMNVWPAKVLPACGKSVGSDAMSGLSSWSSEPQSNCSQCYCLLGNPCYTD